MLYSEIIAFYSEIHTKHTNTLCGQTFKCLNIQPGGTYINHWTLNGSYYSRDHATGEYQSRPVTGVSGTFPSFLW